MSKRDDAADAARFAPLPKDHEGTIRELEHKYRYFFQEQKKHNGTLKKKAAASGAHIFHNQPRVPVELEIYKFLLEYTLRGIELEIEKERLRLLIEDTNHKKDPII